MRHTDDMLVVMTKVVSVPAHHAAPAAALPPVAWSSKT
jgi:hypothetical protein